ncbi:hypothetical protein DL93DRAFT_2075935 [Clavulina sp. PMI_390]|nr:hypothetical protein DL93DRAFT_2075935 [Clavulina sp. PMI_390]
MSAAQERFELEKDALLIALAQARGNATELQEENARLQTRNKELMSYTLSLENKVSDLQRMLAERTPTFETPYSARVARRRSPLAFSSPSLREAAAAELVGLSSIDSRASEFDATPPLSAPPHIAVMVPSPAPPKADLVDESFRPPPSPRPPPATKSFPDISRSPPSQPAPQKRGHRHTPSDASSIMPQISTTMSMLMNEQGPNDDDPSSTRFSLHTDSDGFAPLGDNHHDADADDDDDDVLFDPASSYKFHSNVTSPGRVGNSLLGASTATARQHSNHLGSSLGPGFAPGQERLTDESFFMKTPSRFGSRGMAGKTTSPTESSFALASPPASPGSLVLRTEDEIHLDDLMSLHDGDSD